MCKSFHYLLVRKGGRRIRGVLFLVSSKNVLLLFLHTSHSKKKKEKKLKMGGWRRQCADDGERNGPAVGVAHQDPSASASLPHLCTLILGVSFPLLPLREAQVPSFFLPIASLPVSSASVQGPALPFCNLVGERVRADSWQAVEKPPYFWSQHYDSAPALALQPCCLFAFFCTRFFPFPRINLSLLRLYPMLNRQEAQMA